MGKKEVLKETAPAVKEVIAAKSTSTAVKSTSTVTATAAKSTSTAVKETLKTNNKDTIAKTTTVANSKNEDSATKLVTPKEDTKETLVVETPVKKARKPRVKAETKETVTKKPEVTEVESKKVETKKAVEKPVKVQTNVYVEYLGVQIEEAAVIEQVKNIWVKELKKKLQDIKSLSLYIKPEDNAAYYVINGDVTGSVIL